MDIRLFSSHNGDVYWGMVCRGHVDLDKFEAECLKYHKDVIDKNLRPEHCWLKYRGFAGYEYCLPDTKGARPWTVWPSWEGTQGYAEWMASVTPKERDTNG